MTSGWPAHQAALEKSSRSSGSSDPPVSASEKWSKASCQACRSSASRAAATESSTVLVVTGEWYRLAARSHALLPADRGGIGPQALQGVVPALLVQEHVGHEVDEVQEHPSALALSLPPDRLHPPVPDRSLDLLGDGSDLPVAGTRGDDEVVGDHDEVPDVED